MRFLPFFLFASLACHAQQVSGPKSGLVQSPGGLKIVVVQGEGAINNVRGRSATQVAVEVRDDADKPISGAEVVFQLPPGGPGGTFNGWMRTQTARTNPEGRAETNGFSPNEQEGRFDIKVTATVGARTTTAAIAQSNTRNGEGSPKAKSGRSGIWKVVLLVAAVGLTAGIIAATRDGGSSTSTGVVTNPVIISPGPVTVGQPR